MKKIALVTIFDTVNFGTYLQSLALGKTLEDKGFSVEIVNYCRPVSSCKEFVKRHLSRNIIKVLYHLFYNVPLLLLLRRKYHLFIKKYLPVSKRYKSFNALKNNPPIADIYLTGSDQVWNSYYNGGIDHSFYLDFAPLGKNRVAYAASIGMDNLPESEKRETKELLDRYKLISVREQRAEEVLDSIGIHNTEVVLDPTLLLTKADWLDLIDTSVFKKKEPYLLTYTAEGKSQNGLIKDIALKIAKDKNISIYCVSFCGKLHNMVNFSFAKKCFAYAGLHVFLSLFAQADFVVASSFHGTAFSINMNRNFITIPPVKFVDRIDNLLDICGLQERKISDANSFSDRLLDDIDYSRVNEILAHERSKSMGFIEKIM